MAGDRHETTNEGEINIDFEFDSEDFITNWLHKTYELNQHSYLGSSTYMISERQRQESDTKKQGMNITSVLQTLRKVSRCYYTIKSVEPNLENEKQSG